MLRRLLRRVVRAMRLLGVSEPVLPELLPISRDLMAESYPEVASDWPRISQIAYAEEDAFRRTLATGTQIFDLAVADAKRATRRCSAASGPSSYTTRTVSRSNSPWRWPRSRA